MTKEPINIDGLENQILSATTLPNLTKALLAVDSQMTEIYKELNYSGNLHENTITDFKGTLRRLETLKFVGNARVPELQKGLYMANKENYAFRKAAERILTKEWLDKVNKGLRAK